MPSPNREWTLISGRTTSGRISISRSRLNRTGESRSSTCNVLTNTYDDACYGWHHYEGKPSLPLSPADEAWGASMIAAALRPT